MILELFGTAVGIIYLWLEYRASIYLWIAGIIMPAIYIFIYYEAGLYADFGINVYPLWMDCLEDRIHPHRQDKEEQRAANKLHSQTRMDAHRRSIHRRPTVHHMGTY